MFKPSLYQGMNTLQRRDAAEIIQVFKNSIQWRSDGHDTLLDIGCGSGDFIMDYVLPIMPKSYEKIIGANISEGTVRYARNKYQNSKISFMQMDITADPNELQKSIGQKFDHITSFYCLNWVQAQQKAIDNIYKLLNPNGDCLLVFETGSKAYDIYKQFAEIPNWKPYMEDIDQYITPYHYMENPAEEFRKLFNLSGFSEFKIEIQDKVFTFEKIDILKNFVTSYDPFLDRMPHGLRGQYFEELFARLSPCEQMTTNNDFRYNLEYKIMVAYGRK